MHLVQPHLGLIWSGSTSSDDFRPESWARQICSVTDSATSANALVPLTHSPLACQPRIHLPMTQLSSTHDLSRHVISSDSPRTSTDSFAVVGFHRSAFTGRLSPVGFHRGWLSNVPGESAPLESLPPRPAHHRHAGYLSTTDSGSLSLAPPDIHCGTLVNSGSVSKIIEWLAGNCNLA